jgi:hypothetical protein
MRKRHGDGRDTSPTHAAFSPKCDGGQGTSVWIDLAVPGMVFKFRFRLCKGSCLRRKGLASEFE